MSYTPLSRNQIAWRAAQDLEDGMVVNLGLGMPVLCANYRPEGREVLLQSENGVLGVGPVATEEEADRDQTDAGSQRWTSGSHVRSGQPLAVRRSRYQARFPRTDGVPNSTAAQRLPGMISGQWIVP